MNFLIMCLRISIYTFSGIKKQQKRDSIFLIVFHHNFVKIPKNFKPDKEMKVSVPQNRPSSPVFCADIAENDELNQAIKESEDRIEEMRRKFNLLVFGCTFVEDDNNPINLKNNSKVKTRAEVQRIINHLRTWKETKSNHNSTNHGWKTNYDLQQRKVNGKSEYFLEKRNATHGKIVIAAEDVFDAIYDSHVNGVHHMKVAATKNHIKRTFHSISENMVKKFCSRICTVCNMTKEKKKKIIGASKPINSYGFRSRFQVDLIDFRSDPRVDHNGVEMKWLMVVKDHSTKYTWLRPLKAKKGDHVKHELRQLYAEVGWPMIHQNDNGGEFMNKTMIALLEENKFVCTVNGQPYKPTDQGSVERQNREVKKLIKILTLEAKQSGEDDPSWLDMIHKLTSAMNKTYGYGMDGMSPYESVYTMDYDCPIGSIPISDYGNLKDVDDLANYSTSHNGLKEFLIAQGYNIDNMVGSHDCSNSVASEEKDDDVEYVSSSIGMSSFQCYYYVFMKSHKFLIFFSF